jgi:hypothetical protein
MDRWEAATPTASESVNVSESESVATPVESAMDDIPQEVKDNCEDALTVMLQKTTLMNTWEGTPSPSTDHFNAPSFTLTDIDRTGDGFSVTAELYDYIFIDPETFEESIAFGMVQIRPDSEAYPKGLAYGKSVVRLTKTGGELSPVSCVYEPYAHPGLEYLKAQTEKLAPELSASEKIDPTQYDPLLVDFLWRTLLAHRYIETPGDITLYDLENLRDTLDMRHYPYKGDDYNQDPSNPDSRIDASLLRLTPNLEAVIFPCLLEDYSVFENMHDLTMLRLVWPGEELFSTLRVGHVDSLEIDDPDGILDITHANADTLFIHSWSTAVRGFVGCENLKTLRMNSTRTDMRLVSADTFPGLTYLNLYFYSDTPRVRDFSGLASFGDDVKIDLYLDYQACNNPTLESLREVTLRDFILNPHNGSHPLPDIDRALVDSIVSQRTLWGMALDFEGRTGEESLAEAAPLSNDNPVGRFVEELQTTRREELINALNSILDSHRNGTFTPMENHHNAYPDDFPPASQLKAVESLDDFTIVWYEEIPISETSYYDAYLRIVYTIDATHLYILDPALFHYDDGSVTLGFGGSSFAALSMKEFLEQITVAYNISGYIDVIYE